MATWCIPHFFRAAECVSTASIPDSIRCSTFRSFIRFAALSLKDIVLDEIPKTLAKDYLYNDPEVSGDVAGRS